MVTFRNSPTTTGRPSSFVFRPRSVAAVKEQLAKRQRGFDSIYKPNFDVFKPKDGSNCIRILPATWDNYDHFTYSVAVHQYVGADQGSYLCLKQMLGKPCAMCDAAQKAKQERDEDGFKKVSYKNRQVMWLLDRDAENPRLPLLWSWASRTDSDILALTYNDRRGNEVLQVEDPENGFDLIFKKEGKADRTRYTAWQFDRAATPLDDNPREQKSIIDYIWDNPIPDCLLYMENDYLHDVIMGAAGRIGPEDDPLEDRRGGRVATVTGRVKLNGEAPARELPRAMRPLVAGETARVPARTRILAAPAAAPVRRRVRGAPF